MSRHMPTGPRKYLSAGQSLLIGASVSLTASVPVMLLVWYWIGWFSPPLLTQLACLGALGLVVVSIMNAGMDGAHVALNHEGVGMTNSQPNGKIYHHGDHWRFFVTDTMEHVDVHTKKLDPPPVEVLADVYEIEVDTVALVHVSDSLVYTMTTDSEDYLEQELVSATRMFVAEWKDMVIGKQKNLLGDYLALEGPGDPDCVAVRDTLSTLKNSEGDLALSPDSVNIIMSRAGKFVQELYQRGFDLDEVRVVNIKLPPEITKSAAERKAFKYKMEQNLDAAKNLVTIIETVKAKLPDAGDEALLNYAMMQVGMEVKKTIVSLSSDDFRFISKKLGKGAAKLAQSFATLVNKKGA